MSLKELVDPDCGGANPLIRLGGHIIHDLAFKDDGLSQAAAGPSYLNRTPPPQFSNHDPLRQDFHRHIAMPPQTFQMDTILQEMREIDGKHFASQLKRAPPIIEEVNAGLEWANDFLAEDNMRKQATYQAPPIITEITDGPTMWTNEFTNTNNVPLTTRLESTIVNNSFSPQMSSRQIEHSDYSTWTNEFFDIHESVQKLNINDEIKEVAGTINQSAIDEDPEQFKYSEFMNFMKNVSDGNVQLDQMAGPSWADEFTARTDIKDTVNDWVEEFKEKNIEEGKITENYNSQFWNRLQDEWKKIAEDSEKHPWLSEFTDYYDPYKEYTFDEDNPMIDIENAFERGKAFLTHGDIPSAVLCFESAVKQDSTNPQIWQLLGLSQAENEKDPNAIAALKKSLELEANQDVVMALAVSYTNESLQNQALKMLITWLSCNEKYGHLVPSHLRNKPVNEETIVPSSLMGPDLTEVQTLFLKAVQDNQQSIDPDIQEALGVLFNLSSEYDKAADCFRTALNARPNNAKTWNRLGASLANGNRSVEAVDAYQRALEIQPGFVRARYNVGIICINLKAYNEAAEHFLTALNHQATSMERAGLKKPASAISQMSDTIWSTLRMVISLMGRLDLQSAIDNRDLTILNKAFDSSE